MPVVDLLRSDPARVAHAVGVTKGASTTGGACFLALTGPDGSLLLPIARLVDGSARDALAMIRMVAPNAKVHEVTDLVGLSGVGSLVKKAIAKAS